MIMFRTIFNLLPDFCGLFLAALGVAFFVAPTWVENVNSKVRWAIAAVLVICGILGTWSSSVQHRESDKVQHDLTEQVGTATKLMESMSSKLDDIIKDPRSSTQQRTSALLLRGQINQKIIGSKCAGIIAGGNVTNDCH